VLHETKAILSITKPRC